LDEDDAVIGEVQFDSYRRLSEWDELRLAVQNGNYDRSMNGLSLVRFRGARLYGEKNSGAFARELLDMLANAEEITKFIPVDKSLNSGNWPFFLKRWAVFAAELAKLKCNKTQIKTANRALQRLRTIVSKRWKSETFSIDLPTDVEIQQWLQTFESEDTLDDEWDKDPRKVW